MATKIPARTLTVIVFESGKPAARREIEDSLESMQAIVGGYIEVVRLAPNLALVCDEECRLKNLPFNRRVMGHEIVGTFFIAGVSRGELVSVPPGEVLDKVLKYF